MVTRQLLISDIRRARTHPFIPAQFRSALTTTGSAYLTQTTCSVFPAFLIQKESLSVFPGCQS